VRGEILGSAKSALHGRSVTRRTESYMSSERIPGRKYFLIGKKPTASRSGCGAEMKANGPMDDVECRGAQRKVDKKTNVASAGQMIRILRG